jgi:hypothetical protein
MSKNKKQPAKTRNYHALNAIYHCRATRVPDRKKKASRNACRGKVRYDNGV